MEVREMAAQNQVRTARQSHSRKVLTPEEIIKVLRIASESKRNLAMILLAYRHGMRASEVCELRLSDLEFEKRANHHPQTQRQPHHYATAFRSSRPTAPFRAPCFARLAS